MFRARVKKTEAPTKKGPGERGSPRKRRGPPRQGQGQNPTSSANLKTAASSGYNSLSPSPRTDTHGSNWDVEDPKSDRKNDEKLLRIVQDRENNQGGINKVVVSAVSKVVHVNDPEDENQEGRERVHSQAGEQSDGAKSNEHKGKEFTDEELKGLRTAFKVFDKDSDGGITAAELQKVLADLGENCTLEQCQKMVADVDKDGNGAVDLKEFVDLMMSLIAIDDTEEEVVEAFKVFDKDDTGFIHSTELRRVMTNLGDKLTDAEVDDMIRESDLDGDGQVNYEEFAKIMMKSMDF